MIRRDEATENYLVLSNLYVDIFESVNSLFVIFLVHSPQCRFQSQQAAFFGEKALPAKNDNVN